MEEELKATVNITYNSYNGDLAEEVYYTASDAEILTWVTEAVRSGSVIGIPADPSASFVDFKVDRFPATTDLPKNRIVVRPKVEFGGEELTELEKNILNHCPVHLQDIMILHTKSEEILSAVLSLVDKGKIVIKSDWKLYANKEKISQDLIKNPKIIGQVYLHVNNSGVRFSVEDRGFGPTLFISSSFFDNGSHTFEVHTDKESLKALAKLFQKASEETYSPDHTFKFSV